MNIQRTEYVVGFCFNGPKNRVVLIRKARPAWQAGLLNGVGGHIEPGESPDEAMRREFYEETGKVVGGWTPFAKLVFPEAIVHFFKNKIPLPMGNDFKHATEAEPVFNCDWPDVGKPLVPNLKWLIPLALADESPVTIYY